MIRNPGCAGAVERAGHSNEIGDVIQIPVVAIFPCPELGRLHEQREAIRNDGPASFRDRLGLENFGVQGTAVSTRMFLSESCRCFMGGERVVVDSRARADSSRRTSTPSNDLYTPMTSRPVIVGSCWYVAFTFCSSICNRGSCSSMMRCRFCGLIVPPGDDRGDDRIVAIALFSSALLTMMAGKQHFLYFNPLPHWHGSFLPFFAMNARCPREVFRGIISRLTRRNSLAAGTSF